MDKEKNLSAVEDVSLTAFGKRAEKALALLGLDFGWFGNLFIADSTKVTTKNIPIELIIREKALQIMAPLKIEMSREGEGVLFWHEWKRRKNASFMLFSEDETPMVTVRIPTPLEVDAKTLSAFIKEAILAIEESLGDLEELLDDVSKWENEREDSALS